MVEFDASSGTIGPRASLPCNESVIIRSSLSGLPSLPSCPRPRWVK
jgi:hypothetical protein